MSFFKDQSDAGRKKRRRVLKIVLPFVLILCFAVLLALFNLDKIVAATLWEKYKDNPEVEATLTCCSVREADSSGKEISEFSYSYKNGSYCVEYTLTDSWDYYKIVSAENVNFLVISSGGQYDNYVTDGDWFSREDFINAVTDGCGRLTEEYRSKALYSGYIQNLEMGEADYPEWTYDVISRTQPVQLRSSRDGVTNTLLVNSGNGHYKFSVVDGKRNLYLTNNFSIYEHPFDYSTENAELLSSEKEFDRVLSEHGCDMTYVKLIGVEK